LHNEPFVTACVLVDKTIPSDLNKAGPLAKELPYLPSNKNVGVLFERIEKAKIPDAFTVKFLTDTIGLKGSGDRKLIALLKKLGFLDSAGKPTWVQPPKEQSDRQGSYREWDS
jgi:hypothetical protein